MENAQKVILGIEEKKLIKSKLIITLINMFIDNTIKYLRKYFILKNLLPNFLNVKELFIRKLTTKPE
mgnify:CR=1 FL=1